MADTLTESSMLDPGGVLTQQHLDFLDVFGFLRLPGMLADEFDDIERGFEEVFAAKEFLEWLARLQGHPLPDMAPGAGYDGYPAWFETHFDLHFGERRMTVPDITERHDLLRGLPRDPRLLSIARAVLGAEPRVLPSDGNLFWCDTSWHADSYGAPLGERHVKISMYLDRLDADTGAIRIVPGTSFFQSPFARRVRRTTSEPDRIREAWGIEPDEVPSFVLESQPGDVVVWDYRTVHGAFHSCPRRRLLSMNYTSASADDDGAPAG